MKHFVLLLLLAVLFFANTQAQTTYYVSASAGSDSNDGTSPSTPFPRIQAALEVATSDGDQILVTAETYSISSTISVSTDINITGGYNSSFTEQTGYTTLDGNGSKRIIDFNGISGFVVFDHFIIQNGYRYNGGGMYIVGSDLSLTNIIFYNNTANGEKGGAIYMDKSNPSLTNVAFIGNSSKLNGGAMYLDESCPTLTNITFFDNDADEDGGAIYLIGASIPVIRNSVFYNNTAGAGKANIDSYKWENCYVSLSSSNNASAASNSSDDNTAGSTRFGDDATYVQLSSDPFTNSSDPDGDDNIFGTDDDGLIPASQLIGEGNDDYNSQTNDLTGRYRKIKTIEIGAYEVEVIYYIVNGLETGNNDGSDWDNAFNDFVDALFARCSQGCIFRMAKTTTDEPYYITNASYVITEDIEIYGGYDVTTNTQTGYTTLDGQGGLRLINTEGLTSRAVFDHLIIQNGHNRTPGNGGGMCNTNSSPTLTYVTFSGNTASTHGGGIYNDDSSPTLTYVTFSGNTASFDGGGMYNAGCSSTLANIVFDQNSASSGGGISNVSSSPILTNIIFSGNSGSDAGGGINNSLSSSLTLINSTFVNNTGIRGGGIANYGSSSLTLYNSVFYDNSSYFSSIADIGNFDSSTSGINNASNLSAGGVQGTDGFIVLTTDPFANSSTPEGDDGEWCTSDDGLIPAKGSQLINTGDKSYNSTNTDILGEQRIQKDRIDVGAYETEFYPATSTFTGTGSWGIDTLWSAGIINAGGTAIIAGTCRITSTDRTVDDLVINSSALLILYPGVEMTVNNSLTSNADPGGLLLKSDASESASLIANGTVTGKATVERYMTGASTGWHLTAAPVGGQNIKELIDNANNSFSTHESQYGLGVYDEATDTWTTYTSETYGSAGDLVAGKGYETNIELDGTIEFEGSVNTSQVDIPITRSGNGWNLLGNPYPCALNANSGADASNNFLDYNSSLMDESYVGLYFWNPTTSSYDVVNKLSAATYIPSGQAFFVKSAAGGGTASFTTAMRTHQTGAAFKAAVTASQIILKAANDEQTKTTEFCFVEGATLGLDPGYDAGLFNGQSDEFKLCSRLVQDNGVSFALQCLPSDDFESVVVPIDLNSVTSMVEFSVEANNLPSGMKVYLEDKQDNSFNLLNEDQTYTAQVNIGENTNRFYLHTSQQTLGQLAEFTEGEYEIVPNLQNSSLTIKGVLDGDLFVKVYDISGKLVFEKQITSNEVFLPYMATGIYVVKLIGEGVIYSQKVNWIK